MQCYVCMFIVYNVCGVFYALKWRFCGVFGPKSGQKWQKVAKKWQKSGKKSAKIGQKVANFVPNGRIIKRQLFLPFLSLRAPPRGPGGEGVYGGVPPYRPPQRVIYRSFWVPKWPFLTRYKLSHKGPIPAGRSPPSTSGPPTVQNAWSGHKNHWKWPFSGVGWVTG